ncbi:MFS transporter [Pallidibacillus pasinlerensis]|uniref:MFS transporter n=1 Tax=Pallidibacillus pasinlerensis TaxID=2703818 RepID=A0ABX0A505_9BACI|nr:MFS transporter [Pallidibacillus pasinlerensis]NCU17897.1 MFS transporter [Pallidibacillus pasinlerensis]
MVQLRIKKAFGDIEITKDLIFLLIIGGLYSLSVALSNTFVNIYIWKQTGDFFQIAIYNLTVVIFQPLTFILAGRLAKKVDRMIVFRLGIIFLAVFYITVLIIGTNASKFLILLGAILGIGYGFYWLAFNVLTFEITEPETRDFFNGFLGILNSVGGMIGPLLAGFIISRLTGFVGYTVIFIISLSLFALATFLSFFMSKRSATGNYYFIKIFHERKRNKNWKLVTNASFFQGVREGIFAFVITIYVFIATGSEMALGTFAFVNSFVSFITYYLASRYIKYNNRNKAMLFGGIILFGSVFLIIIKVTYPMLLLYSAVIAFAYPIVLVPFNSTSYDIIGKSWKAAEMRIEYIVVKELFLNAGRACSIVIFLIAVSNMSINVVLPYLLVILGSGYLFIYVFIRHVKATKMQT